MPRDRGSSESPEPTTEEFDTDEGNGSDPGSDGRGGGSRATREYPTRDLPPEGWRGSEKKWSDLDDEERRIAVFNMLSVEERDPSILVPPVEKDSAGPLSEGETPGVWDSETTIDGVAESVCSEIRQDMNDAETAREVVETYDEFHTSKIMRHAYGECNHDIDVPPTASPQINEDECYSMRQDYRQGDSVAAIASLWARSENTVTRHIFGRCSHDPCPREIAPSRVTVPECERIRETFADNPKVSVREVASAMRLREEVVATHLFDYCQHLGDDPPEVPPADPDDAAVWDGRNA